MLPCKVLWTFLLWGSMCSQYAKAFDYQRIPRPIPVERETRPSPAKQSPVPVKTVAPVYVEYQKPKPNSLRSEPSLINQDRYDRVPRPLSGSSFISPTTTATESNLLSDNTMIDNRSSLYREDSQPITVTTDNTTVATIMTTQETMSLELNNPDNSQCNQKFFEESLTTTDSPLDIPLVTIPVTVPNTAETTTVKLILDTETPTQYNSVLKATESSNTQEYNYVHPHRHLHYIFTEPNDRILIDGVYYCPCIPGANLRELSEPALSKQDDHEDIKTAKNSQTTTSSDFYDSYIIKEKEEEKFETKTTTPQFTSTSAPSTNAIVEGYTKDNVDSQRLQARDFIITRPVFSRNDKVISKSNQYETLKYTTESNQAGNEEFLSTTALPASSMEIKSVSNAVNIQKSNNDEFKFFPRPGSGNVTQSVESETADSISSIESETVGNAVNEQQSSNVTQSVESEKADSVSTIKSETVSNSVNIQQSNKNDFKFIARPGSNNVTQSTLRPTNEAEVKPFNEINPPTTKAPGTESVTNTFYATSTEENKLHDEMNFEHTSISVENKETLALQKSLELESNYTSENNTDEFVFEENNNSFLSEISKQKSNQSDQSTSSIKGNVMATKSSISEKTTQFASRRLHEVPRPIPSSQPYQPEIIMPTIATTALPTTPVVIPSGFGKLDNGDSSDNLLSQSDHDVLSAQGIEIINPNAEMDTESELLLESENSQALEPIETTSDTIISSNAQEATSNDGHIDDTTQSTEFTPPLENTEDNTPTPLDLNSSPATSFIIPMPQHTSTETQQTTFSLLDKKYCYLVGNGIFASEDDCESYIICHEGFATKINCSKGLVFNPNITSCDWPQSVPTCNPAIFKDFVCPALQFDEEGLPIKATINFRYEDSCDLYIACHMAKPRLLRCDPGYSFDATLGRCNKTELVQGCSKQNYNFNQTIY